MPSDVRNPEDPRKIDALMDTLSDVHRREVIRYFETRSDEDAASLGVVVDDIDDRRAEVDPRAVRLTLHHQHLPLLDDRGWLEYDSRQGDIHYQGREAAEGMLEDVRGVFGQ